MQPRTHTAASEDTQGKVTARYCPGQRQTIFARNVDRQTAEQGKDHNTAQADSKVMHQTEVICGEVGLVGSR